jgi:TetR/AcrR family transcriptional regulator
VRSMPTPRHPTQLQHLRAASLTVFAMGRLQRYVRSGFKRLPSEHLEASLQLMLGR